MQFRRLCPGLGLAALLAAGLGGYGSHPLTAKTKPVALRRQHDPVRILRKRDQTASDTYNWSGYAVTGANGSVTDVKASWVVPAVTCSSAPQGYAAFWTGIDGWTSNTVEQIGTDSDCVSAQGVANTPTYYAWFEFYPHAAYYIGNPNDNFLGYSVRPGDVMVAEVKSGGVAGRLARHGGGGGTNFTATITDMRAGAVQWTFSTTASVSNAQQSSAEWIAETPYGCSTSTGYCPLPNFGTANFGADSTAAPLTSYATVSGQMKPIGAFGNNVQQATMVSDPSNAIMAQPSPLSADGTSFSVNWLNAGP